jgi:hypothetical protein
MGMRAQQVFAVTCLLASASVVRADDTSAASPSDDVHVAQCRPTVTCTADLASPGTLELEIGGQLRWQDGGGTQLTTPFLAKLPLAHWLEVQLGTNGYTRADAASYVDNVVGGAKLHLLDQTAARPSVAVTASVAVPTLAQRGYVRAYDLGLVAHASKDIGDLHLDVNMGVAVDELGGPRAYQPFAALAATYAITKRLSLALEPHYFADASPSAPRDVGAIAALELAVRGWLVVDCALDAVGWDQRSLAAIAGVSLAPVRLWGAH